MQTKQRDVSASTSKILKTILKPQNLVVVSADNDTESKGQGEFQGQSILP